MLKSIQFLKSVLPVLIGVAGVASSYTSWAQNSQVTQLIKWETESNAVALRSSKKFKVEHFEIPLKLIKSNPSFQIPEKILKSIQFEKNNETYVRWIINPEDTKWYKEVETWLKGQNADYTHYSFFEGYLTASRSMILINPENQAQFSLKVSTNHTGGNWTDKRLDVKDSHDIRRVSDMIMQRQKKIDFKYVTFMEEVYQAEISGIDQALLIRSLEDTDEGKFYYLPGFSAVHESTGIEIAKLNGSNNPEQFWNVHYNQALARAMAEFSAYFGMGYDSPHSQNFLIELDQNMKPTGRIVFRDFADTYIFKEMLTLMGEDEIIDGFPLDNVLNHLHPAVGIMHGNNNPGWLSDMQYTKWGSDFYAIYVKTLSELTGISEKSLWASTGQSKPTQNGKYFSLPFFGTAGFGTGFKLRTDIRDQFLSLYTCFEGSIKTAKDDPCPPALIERLKSFNPDQGSCNANLLKKSTKPKLVK